MTVLLRPSALCEPAPIIVDAEGNWSCTSSNLADGTYELTARQTDAVKNQSGVSNTVSFTVAVFADISGHVFWDANGDGVWQAAESDISLVDVVLVGPGPDGSLGTADDVEMGRQTTHSPYVFTGVTSGSYALVVDASTLPADAVPVGGAAQVIVLTVSGSALPGQDFAYVHKPGDLPLTGAEVDWRLGLLATVSALLGAVLLLTGRRRRHSTLG